MKIKQSNLRLGMMRRHYLYFHGNDIVNDWDIVWGLWHEWHIACDKSRSMDHYQLKNAFFRVSNKLPKFLAYIILDSISWLWFLVVFWWYGLVGILMIWIGWYWLVWIGILMIWFCMDLSCKYVVFVQIDLAFIYFLSYYFCSTSKMSKTSSQITYGVFCQHN